jgi:predicted acetyltransferase
MSTSTLSSVTLRSPTEADWDAMVDLDGRAFNQTWSAEITEAGRAVLELDRFVLAEDHSATTPYGSVALVGMAAIYSLSMTVPGGPRPVAGVTWVGVLPTHRRRGILTALMRHQLHGLHESGAEAIAALWASEAGIYGRFGYGGASRRLALTIPRSARALAPAPADPALQVRFVDPAESVELSQDVYDVMRLARPGVPRAHRRVAPARHHGHPRRARGRVGAALRGRHGPRRDRRRTGLCPLCDHAGLR